MNKRPGQKHVARNKDWRFIDSRLYPPGTKVKWEKSGKLFEGVVLYRYATRNQQWENGACAILCSDGKVRTSQKQLLKG